jgi:hypothetical protein
LGVLTPPIDPELRKTRVSYKELCILRLWGDFWGIFSVQIDLLGPKCRFGPKKCHRNRPISAKYIILYNSPWFFVALRRLAASKCPKNASIYPKPEKFAFSGRSWPTSDQQKSPKITKK